MKCSVFIATSLDGFIARSDGGIDWLDEANRAVPQGEDCGYARFIATVDAIVMGRSTFELTQTFDSWPYGSMPVVVMSRGRVAVPDELSTVVSASNEPVRELVSRLAGEGKQHLYVDGGQTIRSFLAEQLIDEITITVVPVLIGVGRPLFGPLPHDLRLIRVSTRAYDFGFVQSLYRVVKDAQFLPHRASPGGVD